MPNKTTKTINDFVFIIFLFLYILQPIIAHGTPPNEAIETKLLEIKQGSNTTPNLLETLLLVSKHWDPSLDLVPLREKIDQLSLSAKQNLKGKNNPNEITRELKTLIHDTGKFGYTDKVDERGVPVNPEELFLHGLLKTHKGYCMNLSLLYLILGQKLNIPLHGVALPNHFFVRYQNKGTRINIETTERGASYPDSFYQQRFGVLADNQKKSYFLKNLNGRQTLGAYFSNVGMVYYQNQKPERAIFYLEISTSINPSSIDAQNNLANIYSELKKPAKAIEHYSLALKAEPDNTSTLFNLGLVHMDSGNPDKAIDAFLQVVQIEPGFSPAHRMLANLYLQNNRLTSSLLHLKLLARIQPETLQNHLNIASAYGKMGQQALALETLKQIQMRFPESAQINEGLAEAYYRMEDFQRAIEQYRFLIDKDPAHLKNYIQLGWTYYRLGDLSMASAWTLRGIKKSMGTDQLKALAQMNLGFYSLLQKQYMKAKEWYETVISENPVHLVQGMIQDINENLSSHRADLHFFKGWIYYKAGKQNKSKDSLQTYLKMDANGPFSRETRDLLQQLQTQNNRSEKNLSDKYVIKEEGNMVLVPAGFFKMGASDSLEDEAPEHSVYLDGYWIDKYEVSANEFAEFLNEKNNVKGYYLDNKFGTLFYDGRFHPRPGLENYPINNVTWFAADSYCKWKGKRLPTEAEWEKAARGENSQLYPWGNSAPSSTRARYFQNWTDELEHKVMVPVQALPEGKSPYGLYNMAGNVKEWVDDWYDREYYREQSEYANPRGPIGGEFKGVRGGSWRDLKGFIYSSFRNNGTPKSRMDDYGFRCAKNAAPASEEKRLTSRAIPRNKG
ncbi:MAG: SUMF1/EgtB/PvdO family nonheme iron enzyme [Nitrospinae bacterium]|nr:SUMF1/EgtB/PvdO family nonheme iron enzyme [Nitrospinota bacterium]